MSVFEDARHLAIQVSQAGPQQLQVGRADKLIDLPAVAVTYDRLSET